MKEKAQLEPSSESVVTDSESYHQTTLDLEGIDIKAARGGFWEISPHASPGWNTLTITNLPAGTRAISVWMSERNIHNGDPHAGSAWFVTNSVQLYDGGRKCRVRFHSSWNRNLSAGAQVIYLG